MIEKINGKDVAFHDLPQEYFPFTTEFLLPDGTVVHKITVDGVSVMEVPPLAKIHGQPISVRTTYANGEVQVFHP
jgi:hypothetical protein